MEIKPANADPPATNATRNDPHAALEYEAMESSQRCRVIEAMARAAWLASGEPKPWERLQPEVRQEWISYQDAALRELEKCVPEIRHLIGE